MAIKTITVYPGGYNLADSVYDNVADLDIPIGKPATNTQRSIVYLKKGGLVETYFYYTFDLSEIPQGAIIHSVSCQAKANCSHNTTYISTASIQMCCGTVKKGTPVTITKDDTSVKTIECGTWNRDELNDCRLMLYGKRTNTGKSIDEQLRLYGATLTIEYETSQIVGSITIDGANKEITEGYVNIGGVWKPVAELYVNIGGVWKPSH